MPELPEIETVKRTLTPLLSGRRINGLDVRRADVIKHPDAAAFISGVSAHRVTGLSRRGKYLCLHLDNGAMLAAHLRMTGRLVSAAPGDPCRPHTHVIFHMDDGRELRFSDVRRFGCLWLIASGEADDFTGMGKLGLEPLTEDFCAAYLEERLSQRRLAVKQGILDQAVVAGLGNIYADEALFAAALRPERPCSSLSRAEWRALAAAIPPVLEQAIEHNGTTFSDYLDGKGRAGENQRFLKVYQCGGRTCLRCGAVIVKTRVGGRGTCYCPECQK